MDSRNRTESKTLNVGAIAPDFTLKAANKEPWRLKDLRGKKNVVLAFVPFAFSGVCSTQFHPMKLHWIASKMLIPRL